jgi:hypothetical protein
MPKCPACGEEIKTLHYTDCGTKVWNERREEWENNGDGDCYFHRPECDCELDYWELEKLGVF